MSDAEITQNTPSTSELHSPRADHLLVVTDTSAEHTSALASARWLSEATHARVHVMSIVPVVLELGSAYGVVPLTPAAYQPQRDTALAAVKGKVAKVFGADFEGSVFVQFGEPVEVIASAAHTNNVQLIVVERGRHSRVAQLMGRDLVLRLLQVSDTPVFSAAPGQKSRPKRVVVATDFSAMSDYAAQVALPFIAPEATIYLVNVQRPADPFHSAWKVEPELQNDDLSVALRRASESLMREALAREGISIESVSLTGDPAEEVLQFALAHHAELIVTATHGYGFFRRLVLGSVATELVRSSVCSVLCVPGSAQARAATRTVVSHANNTRSYDKVEWPSALDEFSRRNTGRRCTIEIDQRDLGAQVQGTNVPFIGAVYEPHDNVAELIFGEASIIGKHFTNMIANVSDISIVTDENGIDQSIRVANRQGQTLLILQREAAITNEAPSS